MSIIHYLVLSAGIIALINAYPNSNSNPNVVGYDGEYLTDAAHVHDPLSQSDGDDVDNGRISKVTENTLGTPDIGSNFRLAQGSTDHLHPHVPLHGLGPGASPTMKKVKADEETKSGGDAEVVTISYRSKWWHPAKEVQVMLDAIPISSSNPMSLSTQSDTDTEDTISRESTNQNQQQQTLDKSRSSNINNNDDNNNNNNNNGIRKADTQSDLFPSVPDLASYYYGSSLIDPPSRLRHAEIVDGPDGVVCYFAAVLPEKNDLSLLKIPLTSDEGIDFIKGGISSVYMGAVECVHADEEVEEGLIGGEEEEEEEEEEI